jgi:hypothetical protein
MYVLLVDKGACLSRRQGVSASMIRRSSGHVFQARHLNRGYVEAFRQPVERF